MGICSFVLVFVRLPDSHPFVFFGGVGRRECVPWRERGTHSQTWCHGYCTRRATKSKGLPPRKGLVISDLPPMAQSPKQLSRP